jgi:hypothetical protein
MAENPHFRELLQLLNDYEVRYLIVGGYTIWPLYTSFAGFETPRGQLIYGPGSTLS